MKTSWPVIGQPHERTCSLGYVSFNRVECDMEDRAFHWDRSWDAVGKWFLAFRLRARGRISIESRGLDRPSATNENSGLFAWTKRVCIDRHPLMSIYWTGPWTGTGEKKRKTQSKA